MPLDRIIIKGARQHNLKNIYLEIPRDRLVVITGISGSGKSSLAFDTIFAEGQRRYVESLSTYARQFLEQMEKPDVDAIEGLSPAIAIDQRTTGRNPRSTVGTITEIYDYLRLIFSKIGKAYCYRCGNPISTQNIEQIVERIQGLGGGSRITIFSPIVRGRKGEYKKELLALRRQGFSKVKVDGVIRDLEEDITLEKSRLHHIDVLVDRIVIKDRSVDRLREAIEIALKLSKGFVRVEQNSGEEWFFSEALACAQCGISYPELTPRLFSFNSPYGACGICDGMGYVMGLDPELVVVDPGASLTKGALGGRKLGRFPRGLWEDLGKHFGFDPDTPFEDLPEHVKRVILYGSEGEQVRFHFDEGVRRHHFKKAFEGVIPYLQRKYKESPSQGVRQEIEELMSQIPCPSCGGARLRKESLFIKVGNRNIYEITRMTIKEALQFFESLRLPQAEEQIIQRPLKEIKERLKFLIHVGLDYLTLDRSATSLSGGEGQRVRLATQIGSSLMGVLYILDEPSVGLHQRDNLRLIETLKRLRDAGNSVIVVEHDRDTIMNADFVIDMGPGAGVDGGYVVATGSPHEIMENPQSLTGRYLSGILQIPIPKKRRVPSGKFLKVIGARGNNLKDITVKFPLGLFVCVTGVSGSGKSSLVIDTLYRALAQRLYRSKEKPLEHRAIEGIEFIDRVIDIDQSPIGRTPRSNPATYTGLFNHIRNLFARLPHARMRGYGASRFSFNVKGGRCEACQGEGLIKVEMHFLPDVFVTCEVCNGKRYNSQTLQIKYREKNIADVLEMTAYEALEFFKHIPPIKRKLQMLCDVGLDYIKLGQSATTLSGGEAQRVKLAKELSKKPTGKTLYILDEPTTGLHFDDIKKLLDVLNRLVEWGNTVIVIEHNPDVIKTADYIIDLGPEGGDAGGWVVAEGTPEEIASVESSYTGRFLKRILFDHN
uniref:Excinuclease ABC subunit A n=1 Tax=uncultured prokaryote TaxID=198431 RepID=H5SPA6_9ZZZZ|nr:excinuclease ABC subunit A [uncultured prokaryote]